MAGLSEQEESINNFIDSLPTTGSDAAGEPAEETPVVAESDEIEDGSSVETDESAGSEQDSPDEQASASEESEDNHDYKKRFNDTRTRLNEERENNKRLEQRLQELEEKLTAQPEASSASEVPELPEDWKSQFKEKWEEDPEQATEYIADLIDQRTSKAIADAVAALKGEVQSVHTNELARQEEIMREKHDDYDDIINDHTIVAFKSDPELYGKWVANGRSAEEAYKIGLGVKDKKAFAEDPAALRKQLREEILAELEEEGEGTRPRRRRTLSGVNSQGSRNTPKKPGIPTPQQALMSVIPDHYKNG